MVFKRKIYEEMLRWKTEQKGTTALLIKGARRVGKSTIVEEFAKREYESYLIIDFSNTSKLIYNLFNDISDLDMFFTKLQLECHVTLHKGKSVVVFDEIQLQPLARQAIKHLVKDGRYDYIETGSLLSIKKFTENILIPSEETRLEMYPLDYEEFRWALEDTSTIPLLKDVFNTTQKIGDDLNRHLIKDLRLYMLVGGMPQAVNEYIQTKNLELVDKKKRSIIDLYDDDFYKLDSTGNASLLYHAIPAQLDNNSLRYNVSSVIHGSRLDRQMDNLLILKDSMTVNMSYLTTDPNAGMAQHIALERFKMFASDTGLFVTLAFWDKKFTENVIYEKLLRGTLSANLGYVYENLVAQMLVANGNKLYYHTFKTKSGKHNYEIDFLLSRSNKVCPIEVKSSISSSHVSMDEFCKKYHDRILKKYILHNKDFKKEGDILYVPMYMTPFL